MKTSELAELIKSRRSIRKWQDKPVSEKLLYEAIELATYAPNGGNQQIWRFYVILNKKVIQSIADVVKETTEYVCSWPESDKFRESVERMRTLDFIRSAPAAIAVAARQYQSALDQVTVIREKVDPKAKLIHQWRDIANARIQSAASAIAYLLLILHQMGLGAVWMTGPMQSKVEIEKILKVPKDLDLMAYIPVGYPAENPPLKERKPVKEVCETIK
ncbi:MAG: nitroreductase family protein [Chloroflexota bacterium]